MRSLLHLIPYFVRRKKKFYIGFLLVVLSTLAQAIMPVFVRQGIDSLQEGTATSGSLAFNALLIVVSTLVSGGFFFLVRQNIIVASREIEFDLRNDFLAHLQRLSLRFFQNTPQGEVMAYATNDINAVRNFVGPSIMYSADTLATFAFSLAFMLSLSAELTLWTLLPLPLMSIGVYLIGKRVHPLFDSVQEHYATMTGRITESISGMRVIRAYVRELYEQDVLERLSRGYFDRNMRLVKVQGLMMPIIFSLVGLSVVLLISIGGPQVARGELTLGQLTQFVLYLGMLTWPFIALGWVTNMIQRSAASMSRLIKILELEPEVRNGSWTDHRITEIKGAIEFNNVSIRYRPELEPALKNISFSIPAGGTLAIIGRTGSGKTTLVNLVARMYDPTEGTVTIDGHDLKTIPLETLRKYIGFVTQEAFLFSETLKDNIGFGLDHVDDERVVSAAKLADVYDNIIEFPHQFETMVGERGITLSGGQKQRTAIARAVARDPRVLILDDAMSAVDTATEERILRNLRGIMKSRTTILISHRVSTVKDADQILVMDRGEIIERGNHEELLQQRSVYHDLYRRQLLEEALERA